MSSKLGLASRGRGGEDAEIIEENGLSPDEDPPLDTVSLLEEGEAELVNYDEPGLVEVECEGAEYRIDVGKQGTSLCVSARNPGTWRWSFRGEAKWDGRTLRSKAFERRLLERLSTELARAATDVA